MALKLVTLLRASEPGARDDLDAAVAKELERAGRAHPELRYSAARRSDDPSARQTGTGVDLTGYDTALEIAAISSAGEAGLLAGVSGLAERLGGALDAPASLAALGEAHTVLDGTGPLQLFYCMRCAPGTTPAQFHAFWLESFSKMGRATPGISGYQQLHAQARASAEAARAAGLGRSDVEGVALEWFADMEGFLEAVGSVDDRPEVHTQERSFNDVTRAAGMLGERWKD